MKPVGKQTTRERIEQAIRRSGRSARYINPGPCRGGRLVVFGQFLDQLRQYFVMEFSPGHVSPNWHRFEEADDAFERYIALTGSGLCIDPEGRAERQFREHLELG